MDLFLYSSTHQIVNQNYKRFVGPFLIFYKIVGQLKDFIFKKVKKQLD